MPRMTGGQFGAAADGGIRRLGALVTTSLEIRIIGVIIAERNLHRHRRRRLPSFFSCQGWERSSFVRPWRAKLQLIGRFKFSAMMNLNGIFAQSEHLSRSFEKGLIGVVLPRILSHYLVDFGW